MRWVVGYLVGVLTLACGPVSLLGCGDIPLPSYDVTDSSGSTVGPPPPSSSSGGSSGGSSSGGSSSSSGGDDGGTTGGTTSDTGWDTGDVAKCVDYFDSDAAEVLIAVTNTLNVPVYFDVIDTACTMDGPKIFEIFEVGETTPIEWHEDDVVCPSCEGLIKYPPYDPGAPGCWCANVDCYPPWRVIKLDAGASYEEIWNGSTVENTQLRPECNWKCEDEGAHGACTRWEAVAPGTYELRTVVAATEVSCIGGSTCDCDASYWGYCDIYATQSNGVTGTPLMARAALFYPDQTQVEIRIE